MVGMAAFPGRHIDGTHLLALGDPQHGGEKTVETVDQAPIRDGKLSPNEMDVITGDPAIRQNTKALVVPLSRGGPAGCAIGEKQANRANPHPRIGVEQSKDAELVILMGEKEKSGHSTRQLKGIEIEKVEHHVTFRQFGTTVGERLVNEIER